MKANELRIGNWVYDMNGKPQQIDQVVRHPSCERNYGYISKFKGWNFANGYIDDLNPIPITEEWLLKLGFERYGDNGEYFKHKDIEVFEFLNIGTAFKVFDSSGICICYIEYVHQLQNLYFALTGKELQVND